MEAEASHHYHRRVDSESQPHPARARVLGGELAAGLTVDRADHALAARVFDVSVPLVNAAVAELEATTTPTPAIEGLWSAMPAGARDRFVRTNLLDLWDRIDRLTR